MPSKRRPQRRDWEAFEVDRVECFICGRPARSERGNRQHYVACHADSARAERNWTIAMQYYEQRRPAQEIAESFNMGVGSVHAVLANVAMFQHYYELDPVFLEDPKVIPIRQKQAS